MHALERFRMLLKCKWYEKNERGQGITVLMVLGLTSSQIKYRTQALWMETWGAGQSWWERCKLGWASQLFGELDFCCLVDVAWWLPVFFKALSLVQGIFCGSPAGVLWTTRCREVPCCADQRTHPLRNMPFAYLWMKCNSQSQWLVICECWHACPGPTKTHQNTVPAFSVGWIRPRLQAKVSIMWALKQT